MEERQKNTPTPDSAAAFERQRKRKVILVAAVGSCLVIAFIWLLFKFAPVLVLAVGKVIALPFKAISAASKKAKERRKEKKAEKEEQKKRGDDNETKI